jgi:uncharacterized protein with HEPN domain
MSSDDLLYLSHMLEMARKAVAKIETLEYIDYDTDENLRLALTHLVQIIGEASSRVSSELRTAYPEIPWREITGMRNRIVHDYLNIDEDVVWQVVAEDLPSLIQALERIVPSLE